MGMNLADIFDHRRRLLTFTEDTSSGIKEG